jgi:hypothetical protein
MIAPGVFCREFSMLASALRLFVLLAAASAAAAPAAESISSQACRQAAGGKADAAEVAKALDRLRPLLTPAQRAALEKPLNYESAIQWSNLPIGVVPRTGLRLGDLDTAQAAAARQVFAVALSACGLELLDEIRLADDWLAVFDKRPIGWHGGNYYLSVLGEPGTKTAWMLQLGGHHLAYNFTFNGHLPGATPLFFGSEPIRFELKGVTYEPMDAQSGAMSTLAAAIETHSAAKLSGTFTDVVKGVVVTGTPGQAMRGGTDTGFPQAYPTGKLDRGVPVAELTPAQRKLVREAIESYASFPGSAISAPLLTAYLDPKALNETFVGYSGSTALSARGSYIRIDGPRVWMELVVQPAVAHPEELHYHALWRDKESDYGGEVRR